MWVLLLRFYVSLCFPSAPVPSFTNLRFYGLYALLPFGLVPSLTNLRFYALFPSDLVPSCTNLCFYGFALWCPSVLSHFAQTYVFTNLRFCGFTLVSLWSWSFLRKFTPSRCYNMFPVSAYFFLTNLRCYRFTVCFCSIIVFLMQSTFLRFYDLRPWSWSCFDEFTFLQFHYFRAFFFLDKSLFLLFSKKSIFCSPATAPATSTGHWHRPLAPAGTGHRHRPPALPAGTGWSFEGLFVLNHKWIMLSHV